MKALAVLGTSSNAGKSWVATALCAALRRRGVRVAPFKAQNMSNNSYATHDDGEIGRAQAVQAEACGLEPCVEMNPILLKPSGLAGSQLVLLGKASEHVKAQEYYGRVEKLWPVVCNALEYWKSRCDVLVLEGAGSPVELNLMHRDIVNLRPIESLDGKWLLVADIERGGSFAQIVGTWNLMPKPAQERGLGVIVNQFRGDPALFSTAGEHLAAHISLPYLGTLPHRPKLQPESEDSLCSTAEQREGDGALAWIRFPSLSNSHDAQPWLLDEGVSLRWIRTPAELAGARAIVLPGAKNTIADLRWLHETGLAAAIQSAAERGTPVIGICGGFQMLGRMLSDEAGVAGEKGEVAGLGLLPVSTTFSKTKMVRQVHAEWNGERWSAYEIHMGRTESSPDASPLLHVVRDGIAGEEGIRRANVWGTYLHGLFESSHVREEVARAAGLRGYIPSTVSWREHQQTIYAGMADLIEEHLDLAPVWRYLGQ